MSKDAIRILNEREQSRDKVAIWFGSKSNFMHPFKEVLANATDEINNNFDSGEIFVYLDKDLKTISVTDTGRGIPLSGETDGIKNYELLLLKLFAGTNYDNNENGKITTGQNGVGLTVTNYCSKYFSVRSYKGKYVYRITFKDGGQIDKPLKKYESDDLNFTGTRVTFRLDNEVFPGFKYDLAEVMDIVNKIAGVNGKVRINLQHADQEQTFHYNNIEEYFDSIATSNTSKKIVGVQKEYTLEDELNKIELVMTTSSEPIQESFLNITYLKEGGSINEGIINGVKLFINKYCKENKLLDKKIGLISNSDVEESISFVCNFLSTNTEFSNQTKFATHKKLYKTIAQAYVQELLEIMLIETPKDFEKFVKHILEVQRFNNKAQANKNALKKKLSEKIDNLSNRVEGLVDCKNHGLESELFIAEGRSALGSIVLARNPKNQAAIPIRGKILNCLKADYQTIFKNEVILDLIRCLGCGVETDKKNRDLGDFDIKALRYGRIMIATDADPDGAQIQCLLLTMFYRLTPTLIKEGRVYIVKTPLYEVKCGDEITYIFSEEEKTEKLKLFEGKKYTLSRAKGLGELDAQVMAETGINPETRNVQQVTVGNIEEMIKTFEIWMGTDVTDRKAIIESSLDKYIEEVM